MTESDMKAERRARILIAVLGVIAASLGVLSGYFAASKSDVVQQRDAVRSDASTLTAENSTLTE